jgi:hypothetical protein
MHRAFRLVVPVQPAERMEKTGSMIMISICVAASSDSPQRVGINSMGGGDKQSPRAQPGKANTIRGNFWRRGGYFSARCWTPNHTG